MEEQTTTKKKQPTKKKPPIDPSSPTPEELQELEELLALAESTYDDIGLPQFKETLLEETVHIIYINKKGEITAQKKLRITIVQLQ